MEGNKGSKESSAVTPNPNIIIGSILINKVEDVHISKVL